MSATTPKLLELPARELARMIDAREVSAVEVATASLDAIAADSLGAFLHVTRDQALATAAELDARRARGEKLGALGGVPVALKDVLATTDAPTTAGSKILTRDGTLATGYVAPYDAHAVTQLRAAGAVLVGKTNMDEFAMGSSTENSAFYPAKNPHDPTRIPGGSSGGSAVAVAARMTPLAIGTDTGGSIRQPAALTGVVGVKPTYGRVSRYGLFAFASSLDQIGVFARDVSDAALGLEAVAGFDPRDATSADVAPLAGSLSSAIRDPRGARGLRIGVPKEYFGDGLEPEVRASVDAALAALEKDGAELVPLSLPSTKYALSTYYVLATAEASSNLSRYDGVRFGMRVHDGSAPLSELYKKTRGAGFGREVKRRIVLGTFVLSSGYYDAYYLRAQKVRAMIAEEFRGAFARVDAVASATSPCVAFKIGERALDPLAMYLADVCTLPASLAGLPALSLPCARSGGLPVGLQLVAAPFAEATLFRAAAAAERAIGM
ncbi:MAG: Asp-tRNA(Asn)/Glu-tRNA(Gln) amidotransferase subunit GatA [Polyangiaceae bacterium]